MWPQEMIIYLETSEELTSGITEVQEQLEVHVQIGITLQQEDQQARMKFVKRYLKSFGNKKRRYVLPAGPGGMRS